MTSVKFLVDDMCANFTEHLLYGLVKTLLSERPCTINEIARKIADQDRSLDIKSAQKLAEAAVEALWQIDAIAMEGDFIYLAGSMPR
ncbi:MAG: hypothetical protein HY684_00435 [Chloroflexi bacterium]|nr:hypothetical protein [Chloroflexota bacterium]